jgi:hypothetical protein
MGNGLRLRITQKDGHKAKTRKENQIMKNRSFPYFVMEERADSPLVNSPNEEDNNERQL